jgi:hypothetical protein
MSPKLDRNGNIIRPARQVLPEKKQELPPVDEVDTGDLQMVSVRDARRGITKPDQQEEKPLPVMYDFVIQCATLAPAGFDMAIVCAHCPFKASKCVNTLIFPTEEGMIEIAHILMNK